MKNIDLFYKLANKYNLEFEDGEMTEEDIGFFLAESVANVLKNDDLVEVFSEGKFITRHFSEYTDTGILVWSGGHTSKTCNSRRHYTKWRLYKKIK